MKIFNILPEVEEEIEISALYYRDQESGLEQLFIHQVKAGFRKIKLNPERYPQIEPNIRKYLMLQFPFSIIYEVLPDEILIIALAHHRRKPYYWKNRKRNRKGS
jgi:hypothetical protein